MEIFSHMYKTSYIQNNVLISVCVTNSNAGHLRQNNDIKLLLLCSHFIELIITFKTR